MRCIFNIAYTFCNKKYVHNMTYTQCILESGIRVPDNLRGYCEAIEGLRSGFFRARASDKFLRGYTGSDQSGGSLRGYEGSDEFLRGY